MTQPYALTRSAAGKPGRLKSKWDATAAPTVDDDTDRGYDVGSRWGDVTNEKEYVCLDASDGAAVWVETTGGGAVDAADVSFTPAGTIAATDTQAAVEEVASEAATALANHLGDTADAHDASAISFTPAGSIAATDVQAAIEEVAAEAGAGTSVATDGIWAAAGDIAVATGNDAAAVLPIGAAGGRVSRINGAVAWDSGTAFPTAAAGDRYLRTDAPGGIREWYYDGTRWVCECIHEINVAITVGQAATAVLAYFGWPSNGLDIWAIEWRGTIFVSTTNDATKYWRIDINKTDTAAGGAMTIGTVNTSAGAAGTELPSVATIGAVIDVSAFPAGYVYFVKVSTPGSGTPRGVLRYRYIAT